METLRSELQRAGLNADDICRALGKNRSYALRALDFGGDLTFGEVIALRNAFFPDRTLEDLLSPVSGASLEGGIL